MSHRATPALAWVVYTDDAEDTPETIVADSMSVHESGSLVFFIDRKVHRAYGPNYWNTVDTVEIDTLNPDG